MDRGRGADNPVEIPGIGWRDVAWRIWHRFNDEHVMLAAAGIAFFVLLSFVPALATFVSLYGLFYDSGEVIAQVEAVAYLLPFDVTNLLRDQLLRLTTAPQTQLGIAAAIAFAITLFSASSATKGLVEGLNIVYAEREKRSWINLTFGSIVLTVAGLVSIMAFILGSVLLPKALETAGVYSTALPLTVSYGLLALFLLLELAAIYRWAPSRSEAKFVWIAPGSLIAVLLLLAFSAAFSWFVREFAAYDAYGSLSVVIASMTWLWISMVIVLLGAQINAEAEHQTAKDSTTGKPRPIGARGAVMADTIGEVSDPAASMSKSGLPSDKAAELVVPAALTAAAILLIWYQMSRDRSSGPDRR